MVNPPTKKTAAEADLDQKRSSLDDTGDAPQITQGELDYLKQNRGCIRSNITKKITKLNKELTHLSLGECDNLKLDFISLRESLRNLNEKISKGLYYHETNRVLINNELEMCEQYNRDILGALNTIEEQKLNIGVGAKPKILTDKVSNADPSTFSLTPFAQVLHPQTPTTPLSYLNTQVTSIYKHNTPSYSAPTSSTCYPPTPITHTPTFHPSTRQLPLGDDLSHTYPGGNHSSGWGSQLKLPHVPLPTYGRLDGESLEGFISNFEHVLSRYSISEYEKFILLSRQLSNEPLILVKSLQGSQQSYSEAKALLTKAFSCPLTRKFEILERMSNLKLDETSDPYSFISDMRIITHSFSTLQIDTEVILQYFFWHAMHEKLRTQFVHITNNNKPSLTQINEHIFQAVERYQTMVKNSSSNEFVHGYAADVRYSGPKTNSPDESSKMEKKTPGGKGRPCILCSGDNGETKHAIFKCDKYSNPEQKMQKLKQLGYCTRCANSTHKTFECKFKFYRSCSKCHGKHFTFLCLSKIKNDNKKEAVQSMSATVDLKLTKFNITNKSILPTFTNYINNSKIRILRDSGSQTSFITRKMADKEKLKVVKKINLSLNGFNSVANYNTDIVEINMTFGDKKHKFQAVCVPKITTKLNLPGLSYLAKKLVGKGYKLADDQLQSSDTINDLEMILGANALYCMPEKNVVLGNNGIYSDTPLGILLFGNIDVLTESLENLPSKLNEREYSVEDADYGLESMHVNAFNVNFCVTDDEGNLLQPELQKATDSLILNSGDDILRETCINFLNYDNSNPDTSTYDKNDELVQHTLDNISQAEDGRIIAPLMWEESLFDKIPCNYGLAYQILKSNLKKLSKNRERLLMVDDVFKEQISLGIISKIENVTEFIKYNKNCSFLAHMPIFKLQRDTTKCRVVFLSNIAEKKGSISVSHNMAMHPGPSLNRKISTAMTLMRFDKKIMTYDIVKAFLAIELYPSDSEKLCFLWVNDAAGGDNSVVGYKMNRLMFGLRCSPTILMLTLYYILILNSSTDSPELIELKKSAYDMLYMDNGAIGAETTEKLIWSYNQLSNIFSPFKIYLQQFITNDPKLQEIISLNNSDKPEPEQRLLGMRWNTETDCISTQKFSLNENANTKRTILRSIASNFDLYCINGPLLNRARIFMNSLMLQNKLAWDDKITTEEAHEWRNICNQLNSAERVSIPRYVGNKTDSYDLIVFTDSSKIMFGAVAYLFNRDTGNTSFIIGKNRIIGSKLCTKSIPQLELNSILLGAETALDLFNELCSSVCVMPINIVNIKIYSDSLVSLNWIQNYTCRINKMNKTSVFVMNRLEKISNICKIKPITFYHIAGNLNPADAITRSMSFKQFKKTNYLTGLSPQDTKDLERDDVLKILIPHKIMNEKYICNAVTVDTFEPIINSNLYSSFSKLCKIYSYVIKFINKIKIKINKRNPDMFNNSIIVTDKDLQREAYIQAILNDQKQHFEEIFHYYRDKNRTRKSIPKLISQLNVFKDQYGILRVKSKMHKWHEQHKRSFPVLLSKNSYLAKIITIQIHKNISHSGLYSTLKEVRKEYWIIHGFSVVKKHLKSCVQCRRFNNTTFKLNQSPYRDFRISPSNVPFRYVFIDHIGPFSVKTNSNHIKVYLLIFSCLWSRAINLQICMNLSETEFLRSFQCHVFKYGVPQFCTSDSGSSIVSGTKVLSSLLSQEDVLCFLNQHGIKKVEFSQYPKGASELGGLVEIGVKATKRLIHGTIRNSILDLYDFQFLIERTNSLINKRPIAFQSAIRSNDCNDYIPSPITPETLIYGREVPSLTILPSLTEDFDVGDLPYSLENLHSHIINSSAKLAKCNKLLIRLYNEEFLHTLSKQASDKPGRYAPVKSSDIGVGDIVLLRETHCKPGNYPLGVIKSTTMNSLEEVTEVTLLKGKSRETVRRHITSLIPFMKSDELSQEAKLSQNAAGEETVQINNARRPVRQAAIRCILNNKELLKSNDI